MQRSANRYANSYGRLRALAFRPYLAMVQTLNHENHVHIDLMQRTNNYKICQWDILDPAEIAALAAKKSAVAAMPIPEATQSNGVPVPRPCPLTETQASDPRQQSVLHSLRRE